MARKECLGEKMVDWKADAKWRQAATVLTWFLVKNSTAHRHGKLWQEVKGQRAWTSPQDLVRWATKTNRSNVYCLFNAKTKYKYIGMVTSRAPQNRWQEHTRAIKGGKEPKYRRMKRLGGAESWIMVPMVDFNYALDKREVMKVESWLIKRCQHSLNKMCRPAKQTPMPTGRRRKVIALREKEGRTATRPKDHMSGIAPGHTLWYLDLISQQGKRVSVEEMLQDVKGNGYLLNTQSPLLNKTHTKRIFRESTVTWQTVRWHDSKPMVRGSPERGTLRRALQQKAWLYIKCLKVKRHKITEDELMAEMERRLKRNDQDWHKGLTMTDLWRMHGRIGRFIQEERKRIQSIIRTALRKKGLTVHPGKALTIKVPANNAISRATIISMARRCLEASALPRIIARSIRISIVVEAAPTGMNILCDHKTWINKMAEGKLTCTCRNAPDSWPRING